MERPGSAVPGRSPAHPAVPSGCFYCGNGNGPRPEDLKGVLVRTRIAALDLDGWVCQDTIACARRQNAAKQLRLFGDLR
jgi:hypothetical protein